MFSQDRRQKKRQTLIGREANKHRWVHIDSLSSLREAIVWPEGLRVKHEKQEKHVIPLGTFSLIPRR